MAEGYDPNIGYLLRRCQIGNRSFSISWSHCDRSRTGRCWTLCSHTLFHPADFTIRSDGVCRLNPEMTEHVLRQFTMPH
jgi:hypothetical protein